MSGRIRRDRYRQNREAILRAKHERNESEPGWRTQENFRHARRPRTRYLRLVRRAKKRGWTDTLSFKEWADLVIDARCHYCDGALSDVGACLDRVDNDAGYSATNVVPCCSLCNTAKGESLSYDEMLLVMEHRRSTGMPCWPDGAQPLQHRAVLVRLERMGLKRNAAAIAPSVPQLQLAVDGVKL